MKFVSFLNQGVPSYGLVQGEHVLDLKPLFGDRAPDLKTLIALDLLGAAAEAAGQHAATLRFSQLTLLPVIPNPNKIVCVGLNYGEHVRETGKQVTECPVLFLRTTESQVAHGQDIIRPPESHRLDYEGEIVLVIGKGGRRIAETDALDHVAAVSPYDWSDPRFAVLDGMGAAGPAAPAACVARAPPLPSPPGTSRPGDRCRRP